MRLVFMGTPEFAVPSLRKLIDSPHEIAGVVTVPDRAQGRGQKHGESPVKKAAVSSQLTVMQPESLKDPDFIAQLKVLGAECFVVVGFRILPPIVFEMPALGSFNLHASLLPKFRGAAPIQWAIIQGEKQTGVTTFFLNKNVDMGEIIRQESTPIEDYETSGDLHNRLAEMGAGLVLKTVNLIASGQAVPLPQQGESTPAPKIVPEVCEIDWQKPAIQIHNLIRGLAPRPGAYTVYEGRRIKFFKSHLVKEVITDKKKPGSVIHAAGNDLWIQTGSQTIGIDICQIEGKKIMPIDAFLRGFHVTQGGCFQNCREK